MVGKAISASNKPQNRKNVEPDEQEPTIPKEVMREIVKQVTLQKYDDATDAALHLMIQANYPIKLRIALLNLRDELGFDNSLWNPKQPPTQHEGTE
jgi:hypothetical protein